MKKKILSVSTVILLLAFASSCSQDVEYACAEQERTEESSFQCIEWLTRDLRALNARYRAQDTAAQRAPKVTYTKVPCGRLPKGVASVCLVENGVVTENVKFVR